MTEFWAGVGLASAIATALATGVSTVAALWWRRQDRRVVEWVVADGLSEWRRGDGWIPYARANLWSVGDGTAFHVTVSGEGCHVTMQGEPSKPHQDNTRPDLGLAPVMPPGGQVALRVFCEPDWWDRAGLVVRWVESPTWKARSRRERRVPLVDLAERPQYMDFEPVGPGGLTELVPQVPEPQFPVLPAKYRVPPPQH